MSEILTVAPGDHGETDITMHDKDERDTMTIEAEYLLPLIRALCAVAGERGELSETIHWTGDSRSGWWVPEEVEDEHDCGDMNEGASIDLRPAPIGWVLTLAGGTEALIEYCPWCGTDLNWPGGR